MELMNGVQGRAYLNGCHNSRDIDKRDAPGSSERLHAALQDLLRTDNMEAGFTEYNYEATSKNTKSATGNGARVCVRPYSDMG